VRRLIVPVLVALTAIVSWSVAVPTPALAAGETWTARNAPQGVWSAVAYGNNRFVAVASSGTGNRVMTSPDGITWTPRNAAQANSWRSVTFGNNLFVAVSDDGTDRVMTSPDGITWTPRNAAQANSWRSVTFGNNLFVAVSSDGTDRVMTSPDGIAWTPRTAAASNSWSAVTFGNNLFVAVSTDGANQVMTSPNGTAWTPRSAASVGDWSSLAYGNGTYVAIAQTNGTYRVMTSLDGTAWTPHSAAASANWYAVTYGSGIFVAVATVSDKVMTSPDGITWTARTGATSGGWTAIAHGAGQFLAVGNGGGAQVMTSSDGISWTNRAAAASSVLYSVTYGNDLFVAVGAGVVLTSPDGIVWTARTPASASSWTSVTFGNGRFVAVASGGQVMTSPDGIVWTGRTAAAGSFWSSVTYGNGLFVAVAFADTVQVMTSPDGVTWTPRTAAAAANWASVTYANSIFVAVSYSGGQVMTSPNGITWTPRAAAGVNTWSSVVFGNGLFVAVADNTVPPFGKQVMTSPDGITWTGRNASAEAPWNAVTFGNGQFVAVADTQDPAGTQVMTSPDGVTWTSRTAPGASDWDSVTYANGLFVSVASSGDTNRIMTSGTFTPPLGAPTITSFDPNEGPVGTTVTITGTNFVNGGTTVKFNDVAAPAADVTWVSATKLTVIVPDGATTGPISVSTTGGDDTSAADFTVTEVSESIRISGPDEIDTSIAIAQAAFPNIETAQADDGVNATATDADAVVLARSDFFADALAGGPLAAEVNGPLLLTYGAPTANGDILPVRVRDEIDRLINPGDPVYVLGGPLAISADVVNDLDDAGYEVVRIAGVNQFGTAVAIAEELGTPGAIFEATGWNFPDALSAVPAAINRGGVIVLTNNNVQAPETQAYIDAHPGVTRYTIGGNLVAGGADPGATNVSGRDLYATSAAVATRFFPSPDEFGVATGNNFPDALSGGVFMATNGRMGPMLLVNGNTTPIPPSIKTYLNGLEPGTTGYAFGGPIAISTSVLNAVMAAVGA